MGAGMKPVRQNVKGSCRASNTATCSAGAWGSNQRAPPLEEDEVSPKLATTLPVASAPPNPAASAFTSSSAAGGAYPGAYSSGMPASAGVPAAVASGSVS